jgi:hypothetical protein
MAILSTLRSSNINKQLAKAAQVYVKHRPVVQKTIVTGFVLYVLGTTYRGLSARSSSPPSAHKKGKGKAGGKSDGKSPRVAVSFPTRHLYLYSRPINRLTHCSTSGCRLFFESSSQVYGRKKHCYSLCIRVCWSFGRPYPYTLLP